METNTYDVQRIFLRATHARDIAEPLRSFDAGTPASHAHGIMQAKNTLVAGVRVDGLIAGFITQSAPGNASCGEAMQQFHKDIVLEDSASLSDVVCGLKTSEWVFLRGIGAIYGIITRDDLQDPPFRMWLFGLVTMIEMRFSALIDENFHDEKWMQYVSPARLEKAQVLLLERQRRGQNPSLIDCLQFADKAQIVVRDEALRKRVGFASRRRGDEVIAGIERLRNNLAHAQDIVSFDWEIIVALVDNLDRVLVIGQREKT